MQKIERRDVKKGQKLNRVFLRSISITNFDINVKMAAFCEILAIICEGERLGEVYTLHVRHEAKSELCVPNNNLL